MYFLKTNSEEDSLLHKIKPQYVALLAPFIIVWFLYNVSNSSNHFKQNDDKLIYHIEEEYNDVVTEKGRDKRNRNIPYLKRNTLGLYHEDEIIWNMIGVGDSLIKKRGTSILTIKKKDTIVTADYKDVHEYYDSLYRNEYR